MGQAIKKMQNESNNKTINIEQQAPRDLEQPDQLENTEDLPNGNYQLNLRVPKAFHGGLIGTKGATKLRIEAETLTNIIVPHRNSSTNSDTIIIKGCTTRSIMAAEHKIRMLLVSLRQTARPTHFATIPLNTNDMKQKFVILKEQILAARMPGIDENLFIHENRIHLTLFTCKLFDEDEHYKAVELLQECRNFLDGIKTPICVQVKGLKTMQAKCSAARVLYAAVDSADLQQFANKCRNHFVENGLSDSKLNNIDVNLHMTILNNRYREEKFKRSPRNFDASKILEYFGDYCFGESNCSEMYLCKLNSSKEPHEFYTIFSTLGF